MMSSRVAIPWVPHAFAVIFPAITAIAHNSASLAPGRIATTRSVSPIPSSMHTSHCPAMLITTSTALLPMLTPILIACTEVTAALLDRSPYVLWKGIGFLVAFDIVFLTALWLFGEYLLEE